MGLLSIFIYVYICLMDFNNNHSMDEQLAFRISNWGVNTNIEYKIPENSENNIKIYIYDKI